MRLSIRHVASIAAAIVALGSCSESGTVSPAADRPPRPQRSAAAMLPDVRISELHYDNVSTDVGEAIEVSGTAGTDLTGWSIVLYNGSGGAVYRADALSGTIPSLCSGRGVVVVTYPSNGIQNGSPDGIALVNGSGTVVEFLSYEGTFTAVGGPANGMPSTDIGVSQAGTEPAGSSLNRNSSDVWSATTPAGTNTFGACNNAGPPAVVATVVVAPASATIVQGATQAFTATAFDAADQPIGGVSFTWSSTATAIATVDASGVATGVAPGDAGIVATAPNGVFGSAALHVDPGGPPPSGPVRISEIHYDNVGTDQGEAIEVEGPAGLSLTGWSVVLYNGNGGASYDTKSLSGTIPSMCSGRGVVVVSYPSNGIQNGSPDGMALVNGSGVVVEFLSYEGTIVATSGPANGTTSTDIGVSENPDNSVAIGLSLQRDAAGAWYGPETSSFGACNTPPTPPPPTATIVINELMADPLHAAGGATWGEWFEVYNYGTTPVDMQGWTIVSGGSSQPNHTIASSVVVPAGGFAVLGRGNDPALNGGITLDYNYFSGTSSTIFLDATDHLVLRDGTGARVDSVRWTSSSTMVRGVTRALRDALADNANVDGTNWGYSTVTFGDGDFGTPRAANGTLTDTPPVVPNSIFFTGRLPSDPALPVGFEDQIFATLRDGSGTTIVTTFTWTTVTPSIASIDADGVMRALAPGTATVRATAADGTTATYSLPTRVGVASTTAQYAGNAEFGEPADGNASDDFIVRHPQFTASYNVNRGTPNWVSYDLEATHFGAEDRCDCFTFDAALPAAFPRYTTAEYTGAGTFHGYAIDRGHLTRSFDRTSASLDNAFTFYFSNVIPQAADNNQGPWAVFESYLGDLARFQNREVYIIAGVAGSKGTLKNQGRVTIPASVWKVAVIMPRDQGLANVDDYKDLEVIAVVLPNDPGIRNIPWETYKTTVDAVEALSGYDLLALLPDPIEIAVESGTNPPVAVLDGPYTSNEGSSVAMSAAGSSDADGDALTYQWSFGDGGTATGLTVSHTYVQDGAYTVRLTVTDSRGIPTTITSTATVANVAPVISAFPGATIVAGETYRATGSFADPGADTWTSSVNFGEAGLGGIAMTGKTFSIFHRYNTPGTFTVTLRISDDDVTSTRTVTVTVVAPPP